MNESIPLPSKNGYDFMATRYSEDMELSHYYTKVLGRSSSSFAKIKDWQFFGVKISIYKDYVKLGEDHLGGLIYKGGMQEALQAGMSGYLEDMIDGLIREVEKGKNPSA